MLRQAFICREGILMGTKFFLGNLISTKNDLKIITAIKHFLSHTCTSLVIISL